MRRDSVALWVIDVDHIDPKRESEGRLSMAVKNLHDNKACTLRFRLYDDDNVLYYEGRMNPAMLDDEALAFEPLDWASAHAGCTRLEVCRERWETL